MSVPKQLDLTFSNLKKVKGSAFRFNLTHNADAFAQEGYVPPLQKLVFEHISHFSSSLL